MENRNTEIAKKPKNISEVVLATVNDMASKGELKIPANYSPENALKSAYLKLLQTKDRNGKPVLDSCTKSSISTALLDMVVQGLSPERNQCYFIPYSDQLTLSRSYMGTVAVAKRFSGVKDVYAQVVYRDDEFEFEVDPQTGIRHIIKHKQTLDSIDSGDIKAVYATVIREDEENYQEIMTWSEILKAWNQGATKGKSPAHSNFKQEMAKKSVINRACKMFINSSLDETESQLVDSYNRTVANDYQDKDIVETDYEVKAESIPEEPAGKQVNMSKLESETQETKGETKNENV